MRLASVIAFSLPKATCRGRWLKPHELVTMVCSGASHPYARMRAAIVSAALDLRVLHVHRADAELLVAEQSFVVVRHVVLDEIGRAFDLADQVGLVAAGVEIAVADLPVVFLADGVVALADVRRDMDVVRQALDREIDRVDRGLAPRRRRTS